MKTTSHRSCRIMPRLVVACLCCLALVPLNGAEAAAGSSSAPVPALTAAEQAAADALIAKHGTNALAYCRMWLDKDYTESQACNTVEYLVSKGADVNAKSKYGETPLHTISARAPDAEIIAFLVDKGADVRARSGRGREPIHEVVQFGNVQAVRTLVSLGADIRAKDNDGQTPLHTVWSPEVVQYLVSQGADVHAKNNKGGTPLHDAAKGNKNEAVFDFLVSKGADADAKDNNGLTPRDLKPRTRPAGARAFFGHMAVRLVPITPNPNPNRNPALEVKAYASVDCTHESALRSREIGRLSGGDSICGLGWRPLGNTSKKSGGL